MDIRHIDFLHAEQARGITIVIDVVRAFSVASYAFAGGAERLWLVRTTEEARTLQKYAPEALLGGEIGGRLIPGFDFNNSPSLMAKRDVHGRILIQRTGSGTQGAVVAAQFGTTTILLAALTNAKATAHYARTLALAQDTPITLFPTFLTRETSVPQWNEDQVCANYIEALVRENTDAQKGLAEGVAFLYEIGRFAQWETGDQDFPAADIEAVLDVDRFNFAMVGTLRETHGVHYVDVQRVDVNI